MNVLVPAFLALSLGFASLAQAQLPGNAPDGVTDIDETEARYYESSPAAPTPLQIIQYKAQVRGQQRMTRMASMEWYGMSASRPRGSVTPFTGLYSPVWQMPGGRPFAWSPSRYVTPSVVIVR